jgi:Outer membrane efflux protein
MLEQAPDIVERKTELRKLRDRIAVASANVPVVPMMAGLGQQRPDATKADPATRHQAARKEIELEGIIRAQTRTLARLFLEIDANYKQFETAKRLRAAAATRLDAQRTYYEEGRITIDRFLDAVSQCATALGTEAQYNAAYNTSIVALKEAKGTLLADHGIVVAEPKPRKAIAARQPKPDAAVKASALIARR